MLLRSSVATALLPFALAGCEPTLATGDAGERCGSGTFGVSIAIEHVDRIDLVVVVGGGRTTAEGRDALVARLDAGLRALVTGDLDGDGALDFRPFRGLRVGVVSADVGDDAEGIEGCTASGGDGRFVSCSAQAWTSLASGADLLPGLSAVGCAVRRAAETSCPRARPLDAARLALLPASSGAVPGRVPHGDGAHAGFSRRLAALGLVFLAPEDDCSGGALSSTAGSVEVACLEAPARADVGAAAAQLLALRENTALVRAVVLGGFPRRALDRVDLDALAAVAPLVRTDGTIEPGCAEPPLSPAPAPRLASFLRALADGGAGVEATPLCRPEPWIDAFVQLVPEPFGASCLARAFPRGADGRVDCALRLTLPPTLDRDRWPSCAALDATSLGPSPDAPDREVCLVPQLRSAAEFGAGYAYAYDDGPETAATCAAWGPPGQTLLFSLEASDLDSGSRLELECHFEDVADAGVPPCE